MKNKWMTFPCKNCLLKGMCKEECFEWPFDDEILLHVQENKLEHICLSCGIENVDVMHGVVQWACHICSAERGI